MDEEYNEVSDNGRRITITDDFMFGYVMRQPGICKEVIQCLMPEISVADVKFPDSEDLTPETQKALQGNPGYHDVRLDVYLDDGKTVFNVEMQTSNQRDLAKRVRYYGSKLDCDQLEKARDYEELKPTYVIFICTFDPFGFDEYCYDFENYCRKLDGFTLKDESYKLFFNAMGHKGNISDELKALLTYFDDPDRMPEEKKTELVKKLDRIVDHANHDAEWRRKYMMFDMAQRDAEKRGEARGIAIGEAKTYLSLVRDGLLDIKEACRRIHMTESEFRALLAEK